MKRVKEYKTVEERTAICNDVRKKIAEMAVGDLEALKELEKVLQEYVNCTGDAGFTGRIPFPEVNRVIEYKLPMRKCNDAYVRLSQPPRVAKTGIRKTRAVPKKHLNPPNNTQQQ